MLSLSPIKLAIIVAVILVVLGPDKLPDVARQIGSAWSALREWQGRIEKEVREAVPDLPSTSDIARFARSPVNLLNSLADRVLEPAPDDEEETSTPPPTTLLAPHSSSDAPDEVEPPETPEVPLAPRRLSVPPDPSLN